MSLKKTSIQSEGFPASLLEKMPAKGVVSVHYTTLGYSVASSNELSRL